MPTLRFVALKRDARQAAAFRAVFDAQFRYAAPALRGVQRPPSLETRGPALRPFLSDFPASGRVFMPHARFPAE